MYYFASKKRVGGGAGLIWSCPKKAPHPSFQECYHVKANKKTRKLDVICSDGGGLLTGVRGAKLQKFVIFI